MSANSGLVGGWGALSLKEFVIVGFRLTRNYALDPMPGESSEDSVGSELFDREVCRIDQKRYAIAR